MRAYVATQSRRPHTKAYRNMNRSLVVIGSSSESDACADGAKELLEERGDVTCWYRVDKLSLD